MTGLDHSLLIEGAGAGKPAAPVAAAGRRERVTMATAARQWGVCPHHALCAGQRHLVYRLRVPHWVATLWWWLLGAAISAWYTWGLVVPFLKPLL